MNVLKNLLQFLAIIVLPLFSCSQKSHFEKAGFVSGADTLPYRILYPADFNPKEKYPLILFLHGSGERGNDNELQLANGGDFFLDQINNKKVKAVVVAPQCPADGYWASVERTEVDGKPEFDFEAVNDPTHALTMVMALMEDFRSKPWVDMDRLYVGGLSMGGMGTFDLITFKPDWFAAAFPICGGGKPEKAALYAGKTALWIFHGDADDVVPVESSIEMYEAIKASGGEAKLTIYPGVGHASWVPAFAEPDLMNWLLSVKK